MAKTKPSPTQPTPAPATPAQTLQLNHSQLLILDQVGDMIVRGAHPDELEMLLVAALRHSARGQYPDTHLDIELRNEGNRLRRDIERAWPAAPPKDEPLPETVTARLRAHYRAKLYNLFETFSKLAIGEEVALLVEVLENWQGEHGPHQWDTLALASAFETVLHSQQEFMRVPVELTDVVKQQIALIQDARRRVAA